MEGQEITLDRLKIIILDHGEKVSEVELPDPRKSWVDDFNDEWCDVGLEARVA
jgi:hypothetical protein